MSISQKWLTEQQFFLHQAAALWSNCEPATDEYDVPDNCPNFLAAKDMLIAAMRLGDLEATHEPVPGSRHLLICSPCFTRAGLMKFAAMMDKRPLFLLGPIPAEGEIDCLSYLVNVMRQSPERSLVPKSHYFHAVRRIFGSSEREFIRSWGTALQLTGAQWGKAGRKLKAARATCPPDQEN
jgi:hypothetical protein